MLNNEETIVIINKSECSYNEAISVVIKYIYDLKNIELDINNIHTCHNYYMVQVRYL